MDAGASSRSESVNESEVVVRRGVVEVSCRRA